MALKYKFKSKDEIPAEHAALYVEREGAFVLDAEGVTDKARVDEFRQSNVTLKKELEELRAKFDGIDPEEVRKLAAEKQRLEEERQIKAGEAEKVYETRLKGMRAEWDKDVVGYKGQVEALTRTLTTVQIDQGVTTTATKRGLRPTAIPDITARARSVFKLVNGAPRAFEADGATVRYGRDGVTPMTLE